MTANDFSDDEATALRLDQFMKLNNASETGGQAKVLIQGGQVKVNGQIETRRRRKLVPGDVVEVHGQTFVVE